MYSTKQKGARYLEIAEGYVSRLALDENNEVIGYEFVRIGPFMELLKKGEDPKKALEKCTGTYGRFSKEMGAVKFIDPRHE